ncbi:hypothetical protein AB0A99_07585 [Streptomyces fradiae]|uniref:hypothetical protein n=1 Tax=Streptomyces fradiae TaxID=1906 RepID=UPI0033C62FB6
MIRNVVGTALAVVGAVAAVWSVFRAWYDGRLGRYYEIDDLFGGITSSRADLWWSLFLPMAFAALLTLLGLVMRSRALVALAGLVVLGFTVLWMVQQGRAAGSLTVSGDEQGVGSGAGLALGGGILLLLAAVVMSGRPRGPALEGGRAGHAGTGDGAGRLRSRRRQGHGQPPPDATAYPAHPEDRPGGHPDQRGYDQHGYGDQRGYGDQQGYGEQYGGGGHQAPPPDQQGYGDPHDQETRPYRTPPPHPGDRPDDPRY